MVGSLSWFSKRFNIALIGINRRSNFVYRHWGCSSLNIGPLSYPFRSLCWTCNHPCYPNKSKKDETAIFLQLLCNRKFLYRSVFVQGFYGTMDNKLFFYLSHKHCYRNSALCVKKGCKLSTPQSLNFNFYFTMRFLGYVRG